MRFLFVLAFAAFAAAQSRCEQVAGSCNEPGDCSPDFQKTGLCPGRYICCFEGSGDGAITLPLLKEGYDWSVVKRVVGKGYTSATAARRTLVPVEPFLGACENRGTVERITIGAVGDILPHDVVQKNAYQGTPSFRKLMKAVEPFIEEVDIMYGNLECNVAGPLTYSGKLLNIQEPKYDGKAYSGYPKFNAHPILLRDLKEMGFDVLSTSNNHVLDRKSLGVDRTIDNIKKYQLQWTGSIHSDLVDSTDDTKWYTVVERAGWRVAFLACTFSTNGLPDPKGQVQMCYGRTNGRWTAHSRMLDLIRKIRARSDIDALIVTPHWGDVEKKVEVNEKEIAAAHAFIDAGAHAIFGTHVHIPQRCENYKQRLVCYSSGNFLSKYRGQYTKIGLFFRLGLRRVNGEVVTDGFDWHPLSQRYADSRLEQVEQRSVPWLNKMYGGERSLAPGVHVDVDEEDRAELCPRL